MNSIAKMFFSKREQHVVGQRRSNGNRRELEDHDVAGEVEAGGLEHALSTQAVANVRWDDAASVPPLDEEVRPFLHSSLVLPSLLALLLKPDGGSARRLCSTTNFRTLRNGRQRSTIRQIVRKPERWHCRPVRPGRTCGAPEGSAAGRPRPQLQPL